MTVKTWQQRFAEHPMATSDVAKLGEIDDLRREVAELKAELETANQLLSMRLTNSGSETVIAELKAKLAEYESIEPVAWMTADGRVCTANTKLHAMANSSKEAFGVPLYLGAKT